MSVRQGNKIIAGTSTNPDLFDHKWADHILNSISWLRADTFSWQNGSVYEAAYNHLSNDISGKSLLSETIAGITIQFYLADDKHKICPASEESNVASIYNATGVAWYYIIDTTNQKFKLPRTKFGFDGLRDEVGKYIEPGVPNITGHIAKWNTSLDSWSVTGAFYEDGRSSGSRYLQHSSDSPEQTQVSFDAARCSSVYGNSNTVQPPATQQYLYFYVGNFTQTALENTAGVTTEELNTKVDTTSSWGAPSSNYDDLTLGASGTTYTAPADGWFYLEKMTSATGQRGGFYVAGGLSSNSFVVPTNNAVRTFVPVKRGTVVTVTYDAGGATNYFRFIYAQKTN